MHMDIVNVLALLLFISGPVVAYSAVVGEPVVRRWQLVAWSTVGGAVAAVMLIGMLLTFELWANWTPPQLLLASFHLIVTYSTFGLALGLIGVLTRARTRRRVVVTALVLLSVMVLLDLAIKPPPHPLYDSIVLGVRMWRLWLVLGVAFLILRWAVSAIVKALRLRPAQRL